MNLVPLGEVIKLDRAIISVGSDKGLPYVGLEDIEKDTGHFINGFIPTIKPMLAANYKFTSQHILYGKLRPYLNKVVEPDFDGICTTELLPLLPNDKKLNKTYLWAYLLNPGFVKWANSQVSGANLPRIDPNLILDQLIPLPPLDEQKRIAAVLQKADRVRRLRRYARELSDGYLQSVFLEMFGDAITNPKRWPIEALGIHATLISSGSTPLGGENVYQSQGIRFIRSQNVLKNGLDLSDVVFIEPKVHEKMKRTQVINGDVLLNITGASIGRSAVFSGEFSANVNQHVCIIRVKDNIDPYFLSYLISTDSFQKKIMNFQAGATRQALNFEQISDFQIIIPPQIEQKRFSEFFQECKKIQVKASESARQAEQLFQSLLREAFEG